MLTIEGNIVNIEKTSRGRIEIGNDGLIALVGPVTGQADLVLQDELIFPGFVDVHVHARECANHSQDYKEDFVSASAAAINGGVAAFADMPNNPVPPVDDKSYEEKNRLTKKSEVEVVLYAGIGPKTNPLATKVPYKVYMGQSVGDLFFTSREQLSAALEKYRGQNISFHCEDPKILKTDKNQPSHEQQRPPEAETSAIDFALELIEKYQLQGKICHCSTIEGLQKIIQAKQSGLPVTVEVTPHHLFFDQTMVNHENHKMFQVNPPIRQSAENRLALVAALKNGDIDYLATDHAPHTIKEKQAGVSGLTHLDTYGVFTSWLMKEHQFTSQEIARVCCFNPGQFINNFLPNKYGRIAEGFIGSLTIINPNKPMIINKSMLKTKARWSPFEGMKFPGSIAYTIIKGKMYKV